MPTINKGRWNKYRTKDDKSLFFYPQEWMKIMDIAKPKQKETLMILINTGARHNEARHIKVEDVDFIRNNLVLKVTKGSHPRHIPVSRKFCRFLKNLAKTHSLVSSSCFPTLSPAALGEAIKKLAREIGRKDWQDFSPHNVRKTFECWLIALGVDSMKVIKHLGHTPAVAAKHYISPDIFTYDDKRLMRGILGDLYEDRRRF